MKVFSEKTVVTEALDDVCCNMCGRHIRKDAYGYFEDYISLTKTWGFHSPIDGETHEFDLCIDCYFQIIEKFQIPTRVVE